MFSTAFCIHKMHRHDATKRHQSAHFQADATRHADDVPNGEGHFKPIVQNLQD